MENGGVELIGLMQLDNRGLQERLIRAIFGPSIVPFIDVGVMEFIALGFELIPLNPGMQDIQNVITYHPQSGWFEDTPLKGGTEEGCPLKGVHEGTFFTEAGHPT